MRSQEQFLHVLDRDEAERRFRAALDLTPRGIDTVSLDNALGRVLAADVISPVDVPSFDRSNVDGFAVVAEDTFGASEEVPRTVALAVPSARYTLTADPLDSANVRLNGTPLALGARDALPALTGIPTEAGPIALPPASINFLTL